jgi:integrase
MAITERGEKNGVKIYRIRLYSRNVRHERLFHGSKKEAQAYEARWKLELEASAPRATQRSVPRFSEFCETQYRPHAELHLKKGSLYQRKHYLATLILWFGKKKLTEITNQDVRAFAAKRLGDGLRHVSVNNELRVLRIVRNFARSEKVPIADFQVKDLSEGNQRVKAWEPDELARFIQACADGDQTRARIAREQAAERAAAPSSLHAKRFGAAVLPVPRVLPLVIFLANTGCRKGEAVAMKWKNVDLERREIRIWPSEFWSPKNGKPREIPMSDSLYAWLQAEAKAPQSSEWVFCRANGKPYKEFPRTAFREAVKAAKLTGGPHTLRHTFASMFLAEQPDLGLLATIMGHSDEAVTRLYSHMLPGRLAKARNVVSVGPADGAALTAARMAWGAAGVNAPEKGGKKGGEHGGGSGGAS